jgi:hypothetical protein
MSAAPNETDAQVRDLLATYRRTHYRVALPDHAGATIEIGKPAPSAITDWIGADDFAAYLTAFNPYSQALGDEENDARLADLRERLHASRARFLEGIASVPDESWFEPSLLATHLSLAAVDAFALGFEQNAVVIVPARGVARLRVYRIEWREAMRELTDIEWPSLDGIA